MLAQVDPFLRNLNPFLDWLGLYKHEAAAFFALDTAATQATLARSGQADVAGCTDGNNAKPVHYLRTTNPVNPEALAAYPKRIAHATAPTRTSRRSATRICPAGLKVFGNYLCTTNPVPTVVQTIDPLNPGVGAITNLISQDDVRADRPVRLRRPVARQRRRAAVPRAGAARRRCSGSRASIRT